MSWCIKLVHSLYDALVLQTQDKQYKYSVTLRCVRITTFAVEKQYDIFRVCVCSFGYPACKAHAPCYNICGLSSSSLFFTLSHKQQDFRRKVIEYRVCFDFLYDFCLKNLSFSEKLGEILSQMYTGLHAKYSLFSSDVNET
jgi:hypothetical protein